MTNPHLPSTRRPHDIALPSQKLRARAGICQHELPNSLQLFNPPAAGGTWLGSEHFLWFPRRIIPSLREHTPDSQHILPGTTPRLDQRQFSLV